MTWRRKDTTNQFETFKGVLSSPAPGWVESSWWASPGGCPWWLCSSPPGGAAPPRCWQGPVWGDFVTGWLGSGWEALTIVVQPDGDGEEDPKSDSHESSCHVVADCPQPNLGLIIRRRCQRSAAGQVLGLHICRDMSPTYVWEDSLTNDILTPVASFIFVSRKEL